MAIQLKWKHKQNKREVQKVIMAQLRRLGYDEKVNWNGYRGSVSIPFILSTSFEITDTTIVFEKFSGVAGATAQRQCRTMLKQLFPDGDNM
jgi:hypothetical protein